jgi:hypothetical protein
MDAGLTPATTQLNMRSSFSTVSPYCHGMQNQQQEIEINSAELFHSISWSVV